MFAEVNGDRVFWEVEENGQMKVIRVDKKCIGKIISTKAVGSDKRDDITHEYKHPEGKLKLVQIISLLPAENPSDMLLLSKSGR